MKEYQKEYEGYIKEVCENFIMMQSTSCNYNGVKFDYFVVYWDGKGIEWMPMKPEIYARKMFPASENGWDNRKTAKRYLIYNTLTYDEWIKKYKINRPL